MMISLIIPYHNADRELFDLCMRSVHAQTYKDFEVIIVDDGSDVDYLGALNDAASQDSRIRIIHQESKGASSARNRGVSEAQGEYIAFADADDMLMPRFLEDALWALETYQPDFVAGGVRFVYELGQMLPLFQSQDRQINQKDIRVFKEKNINQFAYHQVSSRKLIRYPGGEINRGPVARLIKKELVRQHPFRDDLIMWEDLVWNLELLKHCKKICVVPMTWYLYYQNPRSTIHVYRENVIKEVEKSMEYIENLIDIESDYGFEAFGDCVYDNLRRICKLYFFKRECPLTLKQRRNEYSRIYNSSPWSVFGTTRYFHLAGGSNKLMSFFFRRRMFFEAYEMFSECKRELKKIQNCLAGIIGLKTS